MADNGSTFLFVGTFTRMPPHPRGQADGIYVYRLDASSGALTRVHVQPDVPNPSFLALSPDRRFLYSVNAEPEIDGHPGGAVSAFAVGARTGALTYLNREAAQGAGPCHVSVDRTGRWVLVASYHSGSAAVLPLRDDGRVGPATHMVAYSGSGPNPAHQDRPHAHSINLDAANRFVLVCNQGIDRVFIYELDAEQGKLVPNPRQAWAETSPGSGPRHLDFHPNGRFVYVINEQGSSIAVFAFDAAAGTLAEVHTISTLPEGWSGENSTADVHVHPSGRFVYGSNRGHDSLEIFACDPASGRLTYVANQLTEGQTPRNFAIDAAGTLLLAANQDSDTIVAFDLDPTTGRLTSRGVVAEVPSPVCLKIVPMAAAG
jgi:6-phosphogluconolactonase